MDQNEKKARHGIGRAEQRQAPASETHGSIDQNSDDNLEAPQTHIDGGRGKSKV
jgi:hypothetical protein